MKKFKLWFGNLKQLWLDKDVEKIPELMAESFEYYENPFEAPIADVERLKEVWSEVKEQEIELLEIVPLVTESNHGVARYHFKARISGQEHESKGAFLFH